jgi:hypothetical protein
MTEQTKPGLPRGLASTAAERDSIVTLLCDELEKGISIKVACDLVGITNAAYYRWRKQAEEGSDEYIVLMRRLKAARARGFEQHIGKIKATADQTDDWRARAWLVDKLFPNWVGRIEEIEYQLAQAEDGKANEWATPERLLPIVQFAVQSGLVPIEQLISMAPTTAGRPPNTEAEPVAAAQLDKIRDAVIDALADGPREPKELRQVVCALTSCSHAEFDAACAGLEFEQQLSPGQPTLVRLANVPPGHSRTTPTSARHDEAESESGAEPTSAVETSGSQDHRPSGLSAWLTGGDRGTGDMIRERRGR